MIYTVDRVQFDVNGELIVFEFINRSKDDRNFVKKKCNSLYLIPNVTLVVVIYDDRFMDGNEIIVLRKGNRKVCKWNEYKEWFLLKNAASVTNSVSISKRLGSATQNQGDPYVHEVLERIHRIDFSLDDSGLGITKEALNNESTYGFDFDLFDDTHNNIIEFLNNETKEKDKNPIENIQAHPMRYSWISEEEQKNFAKKMKEIYPNWNNPRKSDNRQKYISLWKAKQKLKGELYLVNYNKLNKTEDLSIIEVIELDENKGIMFDISYKVKYEDMISWLEKMNTVPYDAKQYLTKFPKEVRDSFFWGNYYRNQAKYPVPKRSHIGKCYK
ncbi:hypothetical protein [Halalkalibacter alkaliphilus]|uniref:Uncharacterized protein n=1 Tax=Halalkalibacter alkaliphilus TaxID=2917993 RepID=A0A9X2CUT8_9BACI|nr:hypothetical protein [Halalkalibacter alkaliphilus]MCL7748770.1 hypothetical protein [Halalkalibacter alkaliphilus]